MRKSHTINTTNSVVFEQQEGQSILDASIEASYPIEHSCRSGRCGFCKVKVLSGKTVAYRKEELTPEELNDNWILTCARTAQSPLKIDAGSLRKVTLPKTVSIPCSISDLTLLTQDVLKVTLRLPLLVRFDYLSGQYIDIKNSDGICRSYSLATYKPIDQTIEIHVSRVKQGLMSRYWFTQAQKNDLLTLEGPKGRFYLQDDFRKKDIYFLATGTGIAPIKALLEAIDILPENDLPRSVTVIWGARKTHDHYLNLLKILSNNSINLTAIYAISAPLSMPLPTPLSTPLLTPHSNSFKVNHSSHQVAQGYVQDVLLTLKPNLADSRVYACGSAAMINSAKQLLIDKGLNEKHFLADAFVSSGV